MPCLTARTLVSAAFSALLASSTAACVADVEVDEVEEAGTATSHLDLWSCNLPQTCEMTHTRTSTYPSEALECNAELVVAGDAGTMRSSFSPGPYFMQSQSLVVLLGNGQAIVQGRHRSCHPSEAVPECDLPEVEVPWEPPPAHQLCDVVLDAETLAACEAEEGSGCWLEARSALTNCVDVDDMSCEELEGYFD